MIDMMRRNAVLRSLALGYGSAQLGMQIGWIALVWWVLNSARSPQLLGALFVAYQLPSLVTAPLTGAILERFHAKTVAVYASISATLAVIALAGLSTAGILTIPLLLVLVVILALTAPATLTYRRLLIGEITRTAELPAAYALFSFGSEASILIGPAAGGILVERWSVSVALWCSACGTALYLAAILSSPYSSRTQLHERKLDVLKGTREILCRPLVLAITLLTFFFFFAYGPLEVALPVAARTIFRTDATGYGLMWTAYAVGSVSGLLLLRSRYQRYPATFTLCIIAVMWGALASALAFAYSLPVAMIVLSIAGFLWSPYNAIEQAFMQIHVPKELQSAVFSMQSSFLYTLAVPLGAMAGGWALAHTSPRTVILASGIACVAAGIGGYVGISRVPRSGRSMPRCDRYQMIARD
jgi:MFS family permease